MQQPQSPSAAGGHVCAAAGKVTVLGLGTIKQRLGDRWERVSTTVHRCCEAAFERRMRPGDSFYKLDELSYVAIFPGRTGSEAQETCIAVADEVCRRMFGESAGDVAVRSVVGDIAPALLGRPDALPVLAQQSLDRTGRETVVSHKRDAEPKSPMLPDVPVPPRERPLGLVFGPGQRAVPVLESQLNFAYRPLWDTVRQVIVMYLCQPEPPGSPAPGLCAAPDHPDDRLILDMATLRQCARRVGNLRRTGVRLLIACPVHFSTVSNSAHWATYLRMYERIPPEVTADLAFFMQRVDAGVPNARLSRELPRLVARAKLLFAAVEVGERSIGRFANTGIQALGIELPRPVRTDAPMIDCLNAFASRVADRRMESFALNLHTRSCALAAVAAGIRYIEGPAVWPTVGEPKHGFVHHMEDLYESKSTI
jgi:hypothetical protein